MDPKDRYEDILFLTRKITKVLDGCFNKELESFGLTAQQGRIILFIGGETYFKQKDVHQKDIEERFELSKSTVSGLVDRLEEKDLVKRIANSNSFNLVLTEKSVAILKELDRHRIEQRKHILQGISEEEEKEVVRLLNRIIDNVKGDESKC